MKKFSLILFISIFTTVVSAQSKLKFDELINSSGMELFIPEGFSETDIIENRDQAYNYAVINETSKIEIRYKIIAYDSILAAMDKEVPMFKNGQMLATVSNLSNGHVKEFQEFPLNAVKDEFGADWGASQSVKLACEFGKGYKYCMINTIHKDGIADAYIFYLCDDIKLLLAKMEEENNQLFHTLKFKKNPEKVIKYYKIPNPDPYPGSDDFRIYVQNRVLYIRKSNKKITSASILITDFMGNKIDFKTTENEVSFYDKLPMGKYNVKIVYGENKISRIVEIL